MGRAALLLFTLVIILFMAGCGGQSSGLAPIVTTNPAEVPVSLTVTDTPPADVTVLFFQLNITGATLTSSSGGSASLLPSTNPIPVNVSQLQTDSAFLGNASVAAGTYTSLSLTFANPQLTIFNGSGTTIGSCANDSVCQLTPNTTALTLTFTTSPFPITLTANSPLALNLDIHLDTVIQPTITGSNLTVDLAAPDGVTISKLATPSPGIATPPLGHLAGTIQSLTTNGFTLQTIDGRTFSIGVNSSTTYSYPSSICSTDNFTCLATKQIVKVEVSLQTGGALLASEIDYVQPAAQAMVEGTIIRITTSGGKTLMDLVLQKGPAPVSTLPLGQRVTVTVPASGVTYAIDSGSFTIPNGLIFASASDLAVGQQVSVVIQGSVATTANAPISTAIVGLAAISFTTDSITLEPSQITGSVAAVDVGQLSFTLSTLPSFFIPPAATAAYPPSWVPVNITVQTTAATTFTNFTPDSIPGLAVNDVVSVGGWIFATPGGATTITQVAETVLDRPGAIPLF